MSRFSDLIEFGEWAPDQPSVASFARTIKNALTNGRSYRPLSAASPIGNSLPASCFGAASFLLADGNNVTVAGTASRLYHYATGAWDNKTRTSGGDYTTAAENKWRFASYGSRLLATNYSDDIQSFLFGSSTNYSQLAASAPKAKHIAVINNFVVVGNTEVANNQVAWSGLDAPTVWGTNIALQADSQLIENEGGEVMGIFGSQNYGVVLQNKGLTRMEYVGTPDIFRFTDIEKGRGAATHYGNAALGNDVYYLEESGFYRFNGSASVNISENRVSRWFFDDYNNTYSYNVTCVIDPVNTIVVWGYPDKNATAGKPNKIIIYDWVDNRWTYGELAHEVLFRALSVGYTLEGLDAVSSSLDALPFSLDSSNWKGGKTLLGTIDDNSKLSLLTGSPLEAILETTEARINPTGRAHVCGVFVESDATNYSTVLSSRNLAKDTLSVSGSMNPNPLTGVCDFAVDNRYHRATVTIEEGDDWTSATGVQVKYTPTGNA
jgi:hypothetical protein